MINKPVVSVLMAAYNCESFIADAISSVLTQNFINFELIIVNDCSTDNTLNICNRFAVLDSRIKVYSNKSNLGDFENRNRAASYANGKYLKFLDHDDIIYKYSLSMMVDYMEANPTASYGFSYRKVQDDSKPFPIVYSPKEAYEQHFLKGGFFYAGPGSSIIKKEAFFKVGGFSGKRFVGDFELWLKLSSSNDCIVFQSGLIWWRIHNDQESRKAYNSHFQLNLLSNFNLVIDHLSSSNCPLDTSQIEQSKMIQYTLFCRHLIILLFIQLKPFIFFDLYKRSKIRFIDFMKALIPLRLRLQKIAP
jgi:glycosyltransferase involved in cell wall biosynthesis